MSRGGENLVVDGKVAGTTELLQHVLTVVQPAGSRAELSAKSVVVLGQVNGSIEASERVSIGETGSVEGAITAPRLVVADGAQTAGPRGRVGDVPWAEQQGARPIKPGSVNLWDRPFGNETDGCTCWRCAGTPR